MGHLLFTLSSISIEINYLKNTYNRYLNQFQIFVGKKFIERLQCYDVYLQISDQIFFSSLLFASGGASKRALFAAPLTP